MTLFQQLFILVYGLFNLGIFFKGLHESHHKRNAFGLTRPLFFMGTFVWGDAVVFGLFWMLVSMVTLCLKDWNLFWLITSLFWVVRSLGETQYWFQQQFSTVERNPVKSLWGHQIFHNDSIWFVYQIVWQCLTVVAIIGAIYFGWFWVRSL